MIKFVWIIIKDTPVAGMRFIKMDDQEERDRLQNFYGWLNSPISEFSGKVQDIIIEGIKYFYHSRSDVLFVVGADLDEASVSSIFLPELEDRFFKQIDLTIINQFDGSDIAPFRVFDDVLTDLVVAYEQRRIEAPGKRKELDAFEVLNLSNELQMVALVVVKMQVVTPDMITQVTGLPLDEVKRQLKEIHDRGYLYVTSISDKSYYSIKPFESEESLRIISPKATVRKLNGDTDYSSRPSGSSSKSKARKIDFSQAQVKESKTAEIESAMMAPPNWDEIMKIDKTLQPEVSQEGDLTRDVAEIPKLDETKEPSKESRSLRLKTDPVGKQIDESHKETIIIPKNGQLLQKSLRREKSFVSGKIKIPNEKNKDPFMLTNLFKRDIENIIEALYMGDLIVITSENPSLLNDSLADQLFEVLNLLSPHRNLKYLRSDYFIHPKDADVVALPKSLIKYYSWATILDIDQNKVIGGTASDFAKNITKKIKKIDDPKELLREITTSASVLLKVGRDINTLKIEGRSPDLYLNEVKKSFGVAVLDAGLALSERLIRLHKDCAYIAGFYIRKGLDIAVRAVLVGDPIVVMGDDPLDVYHIIEALSIFAPHKAINAQIWTTNYGEIDINSFDLIGAQEGTEKLFKGAIRVNLRSMSAYGGTRSEFLHQMLRKMWRRRSKERPKFIREQVNIIMNNVRKILQKFSVGNERQITKKEIKEWFEEFDPDFMEFTADLIRNEEPEIYDLIKNAM